MTSREIVVVDADADEVARLTRQLTQFGYTMRRAATVEELESGCNGAAAVLIRLTGRETTDAHVQPLIRMREAGVDLPPLVFVSDDLELQPRLEAVRAGAHAYLPSPVDTLDLVDTLDGLTSQNEEEAFRVLIVDDDPRISHYYEIILQDAGVRTHVVTDPMDTLRALNDFRPELVLMDLYMPQCRGKELAAVIRQESAFVSVPIVFLSAEDDTSKQLEAMTIGGDDFLTKPIRPEHLVSAVLTRARRFRSLRSLMTRDSLTNLLNHTTTKEQLSIEMSRMRRHKSPLSFALIDLDHFKTVNDTYGHPTGDRVLKTLANLLVKRLRLTDIVGRYGGEEFAVVLSGTDAENAMAVLDEVRAAFETVPQESETGEFSVTFSCGVATFPAYADPSSITDAADKALYEAKRSGRNRVVAAPPLSE